MEFPCYITTYKCGVYNIPEKLQMITTFFTYYGTNLVFPVTSGTVAVSICQMARMPLRWFNRLNMSSIIFAGLLEIFWIWLFKMSKLSFASQVWEDVNMSDAPLEDFDVWRSSDRCSFFLLLLWTGNCIWSSDSFKSPLFKFVPSILLIYKFFRKFLDQLPWLYIFSTKFMYSHYCTGRGMKPST